MKLNVFIFFLILPLISTAQAPLIKRAPKDTSSSEKRTSRFIALPVVSYSPETSLSFGVGSFYYFHIHGDSSIKPSSLQNLFIYTLENQIFATTQYDLFFRDNRYWLYGELSYYVYPYEFSGFGTDIFSEPEFYSASYLAFEFNGLKQWADDFYLGPTLRYENYFKFDLKEDGALETGDITGTDPGQLLGIGISLIYDKRNNVFSPYEGYYIESQLRGFENVLIGDYGFSDFFIDVRKYFYPEEKFELAFQFYQQSVFAHPPFYNYALLGGSKMMRGYYKGVYRDRHQTALQSEIRFYPFKNKNLLDRLVVSGFGSIGSVSDEFMQYDKLLGSYGVGLRIEMDKKEKIRIRIDYARGLNTGGFYVNINEAF